MERFPGLCDKMHGVEAVAPVCRGITPNIPTCMISTTISGTPHFIFSTRWCQRAGRRSYRSRLPLRSTRHDTTYALTGETPLTTTSTFVTFSFPGNVQFQINSLNQPPTADRRE
eukprot:scpid26219/ scgid18930/ 